MTAHSDDPITSLAGDGTGQSPVESQLERFFALSVDLLCISAGNGYFNRASPAVTEILGWSVEEFLARPFLDFVHPDDRGATLGAIERQINQGDSILQVENRYRHKDGSWRVLSWRSVRHSDGLRYATARDVTQLRQSEHAINAQFASIVEFSDDAIASKNLEGIITSWNAGAEKLFGYSRQEALGQPMAMLIPPERAAEEPQILARIARGEVTDHFETVRVRKDGRRIDVSVTISPIKDSNGTVVGASTIARDITERKQAEETVRQSEGRYRTLFETMIEGFCTIEMMFDATGNPVDYRLLEINPAFEQQTGLHNAQGQLIRDLVPDHEAHWFETFGKVALTGEPVHFENEAKALGRYTDVRAYRVGGAQSRTVGILFNDITERRIAREKLRAQLQRLSLLQHITRAIGERQDTHSIFQVVVRTLQEQLPLELCCIALHDPVDNILTVRSVGQTSAALAEELGLTEQARIPIDRNGLSHCMRGQLVYEPDVREVSFPFPERLARGGLRSMVAAPLRVENAVFGVLIAARTQAAGFTSSDCEFLLQLSEHVSLAAHQAQLHGALQKAYDDLRQTQQAVMQQERLKALGQMASGIAHDINNAISPMSLYTELLLEGEPNLSTAARRYLETIQRAIDDVAQTVARMREFYRQRESQMTLLAVDTNRVVQQVIDLTRARWSDMAQRRGVVIEMRTDLAPNVPAIMGAESEIREALTNLIFNAVDAMPQGGTLTIRTQVTARSVLLEIIDTGIGMDADTQRRCLEPFFTTKGEQGTGLGLAMVYGVVQRHSADIEIDSTLGRGTTIRLRFALPTTSVGSDLRTVTTRVPPPLHMLLVDDDPVLLKSLEDVLQADGHTLTVTDGGAAGIEAFRVAHARGRPFDIVVTDLGMPHVDGRTVAGAVKALSASTPVILLTGWGQRLEMEGDVPAHVDQVLSKPPKLRDLREALIALNRASFQTGRRA